MWVRCGGLCAPWHGGLAGQGPLHTPRCRHAATTNPAVFADGPTRVLRFSDDKNVSSLEAQNIILDLAARLKQVRGGCGNGSGSGWRRLGGGVVLSAALAPPCSDRRLTSPYHPCPTHTTPAQQVETQLRQVNAHFARLNGMSGAHMLDLYGRTAVQQAAAAAPAQALSRKASKRLPLSETTRALLRQAHSKVSPEVLAGLAGSQPSSPPVGAAGQLPSAPASRTPSITMGSGGVLQLGGNLLRQATVRFDVPVAAQQQQQQAMPQRSASAGVLHIPDESSAQEDRLLPYRCVWWAAAWAGGML